MSQSFCGALHSGGFIYLAVCQDGRHYTTDSARDLSAFMIGKDHDLWTVFKQVRNRPKEVGKMQHHLESFGETSELQRKYDKLKVDYDDLVGVDKGRRELLKKQTELLEKSPDPERVEKLKKALRMMRDAMKSVLDEKAKKKAANWMLINDAGCLADELLGERDAG